jgi:chromosome segregation ATPase
LVAAADDIYQQHQIHNLKRTAQGLQDSQSLLKGQMKEVIAGLNEGKGREAELQAELTKINQEIELNNQNNQAKLEELQVKQQATKQLLQQQELEKQQLQAEYSFLKEQGQKVEQTLTIIGNQTELNQEQINQLQILAEEEKEQINKLEQN